MRLFFLIFIAIMAKTMLLNAQERSASIVFRNKQTGEQHRINSGDFLKLSVLEGKVQKRHSGTFKEVNGGVILLKGQRSFPIENIVNIAYRPQAARWAFWGLLLLSLFLGGFAFVLVFAEYATAVAVAKIALISVSLGTVVGLSSTQRIPNTNTQWTYEYHYPTAKHQLIPGP